MFFAVVALFFHVLGLVYALDYPGAIETGVVGLDPRGWSPVPTPAPYYNVYRRRLQKRDLTDTCALVNDAPLTCSSGEYCAYNADLGYMGCCSVDAQGNFVSDCYYTTSCVDVAQSSSICGVTSGCLGLQTGVCGRNTLYPECLTIVLYYGAVNSYTTYRCGPSAAFVTASAAPSETATAVTTTTTTPTTTPSPPPTTTPPTPVTTPPTTSSAPFSSTTTTPTETDKSSSNHTGAIVGGAVGGVGGLLIIAGIIGFIIYRIRVKRREAEFADDTPEIPGTAHVPK
ncbi:hypothetical protein AYO21_04086 [Fonsecaea monophora]|uniref:Mid2 domain-containing protein n=1 Tax=Fonsecaea monophora TaxID=254056 RepID=A0A177FDV1_9EURO|nr:hypothetical protein AYO21_04086 [Fonsecaea monophora]OAG41622.1 hypothetical protein AYO21_04086 [Fonsecaea monophora]